MPTEYKFPSVSPLATIFFSLFFCCRYRYVGTLRVFS
uniref:Uncharacterized protein n=1 Tax=Ciona intestinalis TaxID=7719 RepID=H2XZU7_CIOIN